MPARDRERDGEKGIFIESFLNLPAGREVYRERTGEKGGDLPLLQVGTSSCCCSTSCADACRSCYPVVVIRSGADAFSLPPPYLSTLPFYFSRRPASPVPSAHPDPHHPFFSFVQVKIVGILGSGSAPGDRSGLGKWRPREAFLLDFAGAALLLVAPFDLILPNVFFSSSSSPPIWHRFPFFFYYSEARSSETIGYS